MKNMRVFLAAMIVVLMLPVMQNPARAESVEVSTYEELVSAVHSAKGETHIILGDSFTFGRKDNEPQITVPAGSHVILETSGREIVLSHGNGGEMFFVEEGAKLTLKGHLGAGLTLRETVLAEEWSGSCVTAEGSFEAIYVTFEGFFAEKGAAVCLSDRETVLPTEDCTLRNCQFSGNHALRGGSLYIGTERRAEVYASSFTSNTASEQGNDAYVSGTLVYGDNNSLSSYGPLNYETEADGSFSYAGQIYGTGTFNLAERTSVSGVVSWSMDSAVPESVQVILMANGIETATQTVTADDEGYWTFTFDNLPVRENDTVIQYDIGEYAVPGFRFSKRGEADVGFELLYAANDQEISAEMTDGPEEQQTSEIPDETPADVSENDPNAVSVTKSPTDEKTEIGGQVIFIAKAKNSTGIIWHLISPDEKDDYRDEEMCSVFSSLELEGTGTERLKIKVIPLSLNGWKIRAEFSGIGGPVFSETAVITVEGADEDTDEKLPEPVQSAEQTVQEDSVEEAAAPDLSEAESADEPDAAAQSEAAMVELKKSPTNEHADLGGSAIFIARADNALQIIWHVISPDDTVDYADDQILNAFDGIKIEGLGTEKIKIINIPVAMNGWKVQAEFIGEANRVLSDKAAILINNFEGIYQDEQQTGITAQEEEGGSDAVQNSEVVPIAAAVPDNASEATVEAHFSQTNTSENTQRMINVVSLWNDSSDAAGKRPTMTIVELYRDDALYFTAVLNSSNGWMYSFSNLPEGNYKIRENEVPDYTVSYSVSGETVTVMHTLAGGSGQQLPVSAEPSSPASTVYPGEESHSSNVNMPEPTTDPAGTAGPESTPAPAVAAEQTSDQQDTGASETDLNELSNADRHNSSLMLLVGILGGAGILCAVTAVYLIRKMR